MLPHQNQTSLDSFLKMHILSDDHWGIYNFGIWIYSMCLVKINQNFQLKKVPDFVVPWKEHDFGEVHIGTWRWGLESRAPQDPTAREPLGVETPMIGM